jgi:plasmid replication initiation protein
MAPRDSQDLMAFPFFSLKSRRKRHRLPRGQRHDPRGRHAGARHRHDLGCRRADMGGLADRGSADAGLRPSRLMRATPYEILRFIGRGTSLRDYQRLKAALDRLQSTTVATSIRETTGGACTASRGSTNGRNWPTPAARRWASS